jgi:hypothetical protein
MKVKVMVPVEVDIPESLTEKELQAILDKVRSKFVLKKRKKYTHHKKKVMGRPVKNIINDKAFVKDFQTAKGKEAKEIVAKGYGFPSLKKANSRFVYIKYIKK